MPEATSRTQPPHWWASTGFGAPRTCVQPFQGIAVPPTSWGASNSRTLASGPPLQSLVLPALVSQHPHQDPTPLGILQPVTWT